MVSITSRMQTNLITETTLQIPMTGSVRGSDAGSATSYDAQDVIPDANGAPQGSYVEEEVEDPEPLVLGGGLSLNLSAINPVSFGDTSTYNLETENGAKLVMDRVDELIEIITNSLAQVGSNMGSNRTKCQHCEHASIIYR